MFLLFWLTCQKSVAVNAIVMLKETPTKKLPKLMIYLKKVTMLCLLILLMSCAMQSNKQTKIKQGVYGYVTWLQGNMMPSPGEPRSTIATPIERKIKIYEVTTLNEVTGQAPLFKSINTKLVKSVKSDENGYYECELPAGIYSVFTQEANGFFFANNFNGNGQITIVKIKLDSVVKLDVLVNYKAAY